MFALADCNNFYASCEEVFNPKLAKQPLVILSNNDGCIIARSKKAKELGIKMGEPAYLYEKMAASNQIRMLSANFALYADMSDRVMQTLSSYAPDMEIYSIDEAFFNLGEAADLREDAIRMRQKVKKWTGIPVSIGIGPTKTLAKAANEAAKKDSAGVCLLASPAEIQKHLEKLDVEEIWGIGSASQERLKRRRIYTAAELAGCDDQTIRKLLGVNGLRTALELRGISCLPLGATNEKRQSIVCSRSFKEPLSALSDLEAAVASFASIAGEKLRRQKSLAGFLSVFIASSPFKEPYIGRSCHIELPNPAAYTPELIRLAKKALLRIYQNGVKYKRAGVLLGDFCDSSARQTDWLTPPKDSPQKERLMETIDRINCRYDRDAVRFAASGPHAQGCRKRESPKFTTSWNDLLTI